MKGLCSFLQSFGKILWPSLITLWRTPGKKLSTLVGIGTVSISVRFSFDSLTDSARPSSFPFRSWRIYLYKAHHQNLRTPLSYTPRCRPKPSSCSYRRDSWLLSSPVAPEVAPYRTDGHEPLVPFHLHHDGLQRKDRAIFLGQHPSECR